jgi:protein-S-isoprenylcysteine O-methyltransferase
VIAFAALLIAWIAGEAVLSSPDRPARGTLAGATAAIVFSSQLAGVIEHLVSGRSWCAPIGIALFAAGIAVRWWSIATLRDAFASRLDSATLLTTGPYRWMRHPSELGLIAAVAGGAVMLASFAALAGAAALIPLAIVRCRREDRALARSHGARYQAWVRTLAGKSAG